MAPTTSATKTRAGRSVKSKVKPDAHEVPKMAEVKKVEKRKKKEEKKKPEPKKAENETASGSAAAEVEMAAADEEEMPEVQPTKAVRVEKRKKKEEKKKPEPKKKENETASGSATEDVEMAAADEEEMPEEQPTKAVRGQKEKKEEKDKKKDAAKRKSEAAEKKKKDEVRKPEAAKRKSGKVSPAPAPQASAVPISLASSQGSPCDEASEINNQFNKMIVGTFASYSKNELAQRYENGELSYENYKSRKLLESLIQYERKGVKEAVAKESQDAAAFLRLQDELDSVKKELVKEKEEHEFLRSMYEDSEKRLEEERRKSNSCSLKR